MTRSDAESFLVSSYPAVIITAHRILKSVGLASGVVTSNWSATPAADESPRSYLDVAIQDALNLYGAASIDGVTDGRQARDALRIAFLSSVIPDLRMGLFNQSNEAGSQSLQGVIDGLVADLARLKKDYTDLYPDAAALLTAGARGGQLCPTPWAGRRPAYGHGWRGGYGGHTGYRGAY